MTLPRLDGSSRTVLIPAGLLTVVIAVLDRSVDLNISFGFLYLFPILLAATILTRWQIVGAAVLCTVLSDVFDPFPFSWPVSAPDDVLVFCALAGTGLFVYEVTRSRRREMANLRRVQEESAARREAEEQLEFLIDSSPAAILTTSADCTILRANAAAHRLLGVPAGELPGKNIRPFIPALGRVPFFEMNSPTFRTGMQCRGERRGGDVFLANVFFSTYATAGGPRLAALIVDASEELREREETSLEQLMAGSRILVGAVSHEVRNVCGAIAVIYENLLRTGRLAGNQDFEALGALVETLSRIASLDLKQAAGEAPAEVIDLPELLGDLRIVLEPYCSDSGITLRWEIEPGLPPVWADRHSLLQVFLNLTKNSERAMENSALRDIEITAKRARDTVRIRFTDSGPGLATTTRLFEPFQKGADATGLGLYLSRAFLRSVRGDLHYEASPAGCCFAIDLAITGPQARPAAPEAPHATDSTAIAR